MMNLIVLQYQMIYYYLIINIENSNYIIFNHDNDIFSFNCIKNKHNKYEVISLDKLYDYAINDPINGNFHLHLDANSHYYSYIFEIIDDYEFEYIKLKCYSEDLNRYLTSDDLKI